MSYAKVFIAVLAVLLLSCTAFAYEVPLSSFGFNSISVEKQSSRECKDLNISLPDSALSENGSGILSLQADFNAYLDDSSYISVSVNDCKEQILWPENFSCTQSCWTRVFIPELKQGPVKVSLCAVLGGSTKSVSLGDNSFVGIFDTPVLQIQNESPSKIFLGERAKMSIVVTNSGTKEASIFVQFIHPDTRAKVPISSFDIVEGDSSASTILAAGETKKFDYYIKPSMVSSYNLPSAALFFTNIFGEKQSIISNHPQMSVVDQLKLETSFIVLNEKNPYQIKLLLKNNSSDTFTGKAIISPQTAFDTPVIDVEVQPSSEKEITFSTKDLPAGKYSFFATVSDSNDTYTSNAVNLEVEQTSTPFQIIFAVVCVIIGAGIFAWIYFARK